MLYCDLTRTTIATSAKSNEPIQMYLLMPLKTYITDAVADAAAVTKMMAGAIDFTSTPLLLFFIQIVLTTLFCYRV